MVTAAQKSAKNDTTKADAKVEADVANATDEKKPRVIRPAVEIAQAKFETARKRAEKAYERKVKAEAELQKCAEDIDESVTEMELYAKKASKFNVELVIDEKFYAAVEDGEEGAAEEAAVAEDEGFSAGEDYVL